VTALRQEVWILGRIQSKNPGKKVQPAKPEEQMTPEEKKAKQAAEDAATEAANAGRDAATKQDTPVPGSEGPSMDCATQNCISNCVAEMMLPRLLDCIAAGYYLSAGDMLFFQRMKCNANGCVIDPAPYEEGGVQLGGPGIAPYCKGDPSGPETSCFFGDGTCGEGVPLLKFLWWTDPAPYSTPLREGRVRMVGADPFAIIVLSNGEWAVDPLKYP